MVSRDPEVRLPIRHTLTIVAASLALAACGNTGPIKKTFDNPNYTDSSYNDILVIGVAGDHDNRAAFERAMVSRIKAEGAKAAPYYTVVGRIEPIRRTTVDVVVRSRGFDSVLLIRVISRVANISVQDISTKIKVPKKRGNRAIDLFRYDYDELIEPGDFVLSSTVVLSAEMFHVTDEVRMWAIESTIFDMENIGQLFEVAADMIIGQLKKDNLIDSYKTEYF